MTNDKPKKPGKPKGSPKTGGRQKGTPNKNHSVVAAALDQENFNIFAEFAALYERMDDVQKLAELKFLMRFMYQKLPEIVDQTPTEKEEDNGPELSRGELLQFAKMK